MAHRRPRRQSRGFTLVELMSAATIGIIILLGIVEAFRSIAGAVSDGRSNVELSTSLRLASTRLRADLEGITVPARPLPDAGAAMGYIELHEDVDFNNPLPYSPGIDTDKSFQIINNAGNVTLNLNDSITGDLDDCIMFTTRSLSEPFGGRVENRVVNNANFGYTRLESAHAEVIYWLQYENTVKGIPLYTLRRRALLIRPDLNVNGALPNIPAGQIALPANYLTFLNENDLSVSVLPNGRLRANSLADLSIRRNRVAHDWTTWPNHIVRTNIPNYFGIAMSNGYFAGEDIVIDNVIGFDMRVYDPRASIQVDPTGAHTQIPTDPGHGSANNGTLGLGAFVDLGYAMNAAGTYNNVSFFSSAPHPKSFMFNGLNGPAVPVYDTWTNYYERDGINQDGDVDGNNNPVIDEGTDGIDNANDVPPPNSVTYPNPGVAINAVDDVLERETSAPYPFALRGMQLVIRCFDASNNQTRQVTVTHDFTPE